MLVVSIVLLRNEATSAIGLGGVMIGIICLAIERASPRGSPRLAQMMLDCGLDMVSRFADEFSGAAAIYFPGSSSNPARALVPIGVAPASTDAFAGAVVGSSTETVGRTPVSRGDRLLVMTTGMGGEVVGLILTAPGCWVARTLAAPPDASASALGAVLRDLLAGDLGLASDVEIAGQAPRVSAVLRGVVDPAMNPGLGSPFGSVAASVAAAIVAEAYGRPTRIALEQVEGHVHTVEIEIMP